MLTVSDFLMLAAIMLRFKEVGGWNIYEVGLLYGMAWIAMALYRTFAAELHNFDRYIVHGEFDGLLVRPWPTLLTLLGRNFEPHRLGAALQGAMILAIAVNHLTKTGALHSWGVAYIVAASFFGALIPFGLSLLTATLAFWVVRTGELQPFTMYAPMTASQYPLTVYPRWLRWLLSSILPVGVYQLRPGPVLAGKRRLRGIAGRGAVRLGWSLLRWPTSSGAPVNGIITARGVSGTREVMTWQRSSKRKSLRKYFASPKTGGDFWGRSEASFPTKAAR